MPQLLVAILILGLGYYGLKFFARAPPAAVARMVRYGGGIIAGLVGLLLLLRGRIDMGMAGIGLGVWLAGIPGLKGRNPFAARGPASGQSQVRSATIQMSLDHASGEMQGQVISGPQTGRSLDTFARPELIRLYSECVLDDPDGARLLEAYLDRRFAGWRQAGKADRDTSGAHGRRPGAGVSEQEAYEILGLGQGASRDDVVRAHRALMKKLHPDHGGSTALAARVNEAKDVLLRRGQ